MKKDNVDITLSAENLSALTTNVTALRLAIDFAVGLDEDERKRLARLGRANETFSRGVIELAGQHPDLVPSTISLAALQRDLVARDQLLPLLLQLQTITKLLDDTVILLGVDIYNGARALYLVLQVVGEAHGLSDILNELKKRFLPKGKLPSVPSTPGAGTPPAPGA